MSIPWEAWKNIHYLDYDIAKFLTWAYSKGAFGANVYQDTMEILEIYNNGQPDDE